MWGSDEVDIEHLISLVEERPVLGDKDKSLDEYKSDREKEREREAFKVSDAACNPYPFACGDKLVKFVCLGTVRHRSFDICVKRSPVQYRERSRRETV